MSMLPVAPSEIQDFIRGQRVARLSTTDRSGQPHLVPVCFAYDGMCVYIAIDQKPKRVSPLRLKRVRNILENPRVVLLLDHYEESWEKLAYVLIQGIARIVETGPQRDEAIALLRDKYTQYRGMDLDLAPVIEITPERFIPWGALSDS